MSTRSTSVLIVDDHHFIRSALRSFIASTTEFILFGEAENGAAALELLKSKKPDIMILDLEMPVLSGFDVLKEIKSKKWNFRTIVLSAHYNEFIFKELLKLGASSYLPKNSNDDEFLKALRSVRDSGFYITPSVTKEVVLDLINENKVAFLLSEKIFSDRELEVINLICEGLHNKEIADRLFISVNTVKYHIKAIYKRMAVNSHAALIKYAIRVGITGVNTAFDKKVGI